MLHFGESRRGRQLQCLLFHVYVICSPQRYFVNYSFHSKKFSPVTRSSEELSNSTSVRVTRERESEASCLVLFYFFFQQFARGCWFGGSYVCCPAGELDLLARGGLWAREVPCIPCCPVTRSSAGVPSLMFQPFLPSRGFVSVLAVCAGRDVTARWRDDRHVSCHRRRSRGRVTVTWLFPASERKEVAEDGS